MRSLPSSKWMQSTGQTSTQDWSVVSMQGCVMTNVTADLPSACSEAGVRMRPHAGLAPSYRDAAGASTSGAGSVDEGLATAITLTLARPEAIARDVDLPFST